MKTSKTLTILTVVAFVILCAVAAMAIFTGNNFAVELAAAVVLGLAGTAVMLEARKNKEEDNAEA